MARRDSYLCPRFSALALGISLTVTSIPSDAVTHPPCFSGRINPSFPYVTQALAPSASWMIQYLGLRSRTANVQVMRSILPLLFLLPSAAGSHSHGSGHLSWEMPVLALTVLGMAIFPRFTKKKHKKEHDLPASQLVSTARDPSQPISDATAALHSLKNMLLRKSIEDHTRYSIVHSLVAIATDAKVDLEIALEAVSVLQEAAKVPGDTGERAIAGLLAIASSPEANAEVSDGALQVLLPYFSMEQAGFIAQDVIQLMSSGQTLRQELIRNLISLLSGGVPYKDEKTQGLFIASLAKILVYAPEVLARNITTFHLIERLLEVRSPKNQKKTFNEILEPLFFRNPEVFTDTVLTALKTRYGPHVPEIEYLTFYAHMHRPGPRETFPGRSTLSAPLQRALVINNIKDGQGDEVLRNGTIVQTLLDRYPQLQVVIYTSRTFLYDHPRVRAHDIKDFKPPKKKLFDFVLYHSDSFPLIPKVDKILPDFLKRNPPAVEIRTDKKTSPLHFSSVLIDGHEIHLPPYEGNLYVPLYRLCAELGWPFRFGTQEPAARHSLFVGRKNDEVDDYWNTEIRSLNHEDRPILLLNGFGGMAESKGFSSSEFGQKNFSREIEALILRGYFVILLPNHQQWGSTPMAEQVREKVQDDLKPYITIAPSPMENPRFLKYLLQHIQKDHGDQLLTVEGGFMHLAFNMGKPFRVFGKRDSGDFSVWLSAAASIEQRPISGTEIASHLDAPPARILPLFFPFLPGMGHHPFWMTALAGLIIAMTQHRTPSVSYQLFNRAA